MKTIRLLGLWSIAAAALTIATGCGAKKKEVTELQRKQAAHLASEAQFAMTIKDYAGAEGSLAKAIELTPDEGGLWVTLGAVRMKQGRRDAAKDAYKRALGAYELEASEAKADPEPRLKQVYVLALLGRKDDGRSLLDKAAKQFPNNRDVKLFIESQQLERMQSDPAFKEMAL